MSLTPSHLYQQKVQKGLLQLDSQQEEILPVLDDVVVQIESSSLIEEKGVTVWREKEKLAQGLYLYGPVGRGKSMLMQLVFDCVPFEEKRRVHFHAFMEELHDRMHKTKAPVGVDLMLQIASDIAKDARLLCFDEFYVTNIADAMLLGRLLDSLFFCGVILCATSNWPIDNLFQDGHNRQQFMPFMKKLKNHVKAVDLSGGEDWRRQNISMATEKSAQEVFEAWAGKKPSVGEESLGSYAVPTLGHENDVIWFDFQDLCGHHLGRVEYLDLCDKIQKVVISGVPELSENEADSAMRFVVLVDLLYENQIPLFVESNVSLDDLCTKGAVAFAFQRTISRVYALNSLS